MRGGDVHRDGDKEAAAGDVRGTSPPLPPRPSSSPSSLLPPLNLRAAALRSPQNDCLSLFCGSNGRPASWEQASSEELAWVAEVAAATAHLPPASHLLPRETTAALVARAVEGRRDGEGLGSGEAAALCRLKGRLDDAGLKLPTVQIQLQSLSIDRHRRRQRRRRRRGGKGVKGNGDEPAFPSLVSPFFSVASDIASALSSLFFLNRGGGGQEDGGEGDGDKQQQQWRRTLDDSTGVLLPGATTLLLGPPGSGKTTLLRALSGRLKPGNGVRIVNGDRVLYNGLRGDEASPPSPGGFSLPRTVSYVSAYDRHIPNLTVRETLRFAEECHGGDPTIRPLLESLVTIEERRKKKGGSGGSGGSVAGSSSVTGSSSVAGSSSAATAAAGGGSSSNSNNKPAADLALEALMAALCNPANSTATEWILRVLRLTRAADTIVGGDALHRGVSGGASRVASSSWAPPAPCSWTRSPLASTRAPPRRLPGP